MATTSEDIALAHASETCPKAASDYARRMMDQALDASMSQMHAEERVSILTFALENIASGECPDWAVQDFARLTLLAVADN